MQRLRGFAVCLLALVASNISIAASASPEFAVLLGTWETQIRSRGQNICNPCRWVIQDVAANGDILGQFLRGDAIRPLQAKAVRNGDRVEVEGLFLSSNNKLSLVLDGDRYLSGRGSNPASVNTPLLIQFHKVP